MRIIMLLAVAAAVTGLNAAEHEATPVSSITVRDGFRVERLRSAQDDEGSWISMTFDARGRLIFGRDDAGLMRLTEPGDPSRQSMERLDSTFKHVRGVLFAHNSLYLTETNGRGIFRLQDRDADDRFETVTLLKELDYRSRYGHGANQIVAGPDGMIYFVIGNDVSFPQGVSPRSPYRNPRNDWLLPDPHDLGQDDRVGFILRMDPDGKTWEIIAGGLRNQVDLAFNEHGEMFSWDADMEWDVGLPWYRPTRLVHVVSGGESGWRWGGGKWPAWSPDSQPAILDTGLGSPTGMVFGTRTTFPGAFGKALYMADWQNGRILAVHLSAQGAGWSARSELFLEGSPLNVCDLEIGPDGALYFITGGRGSQSGLYRVTPIEGAHPEISVPADSVDAAESRQQRLRLERLHVLPPRDAVQKDAAPVVLDPAEVTNVLAHLGHGDSALRYAARLAYERLHELRLADFAMLANEPLDARLTAALAIARSGLSEDHAALRTFYAGLSGRDLSREQQLWWLRGLQLSLIRGGAASATEGDVLIAALSTIQSDDSAAVNRLRTELLVALDAPGIVRETLDLLDRTPAQEEQIHLARILTHARQGWTIELRERFVAWLIRAKQFRGGKLLPKALDFIRDDFTAGFDEATTFWLAPSLHRLSETRLADTAAPAITRPFLKRRTMDEVLTLAANLKPEDRPAARGRTALAAAACLRCHRIGDEGGQIGPDLSTVGRRFDTRALLESILNPSKEIDPKYRQTTYILSDGRSLTGTASGVGRDQLTIETDSLTQASTIISRADIEETHPSPVSPMPQGLLDVLTDDEVLDLLALLRRRE